jgi:hypothetical protein
MAQAAPPGMTIWVTASPLRRMGDAGFELQPEPGELASLPPWSRQRQPPAAVPVVVAVNGLGRVD